MVRPGLDSTVAAERSGNDGGDAPVYVVFLGDELTEEKAA